MICNYYQKVKTAEFLSQQLVGKIIRLTAQELGLKNDFSVTVLLVDDKKIRTLNKQYRQKDKVTDVLSFSAWEGMQLPKVEQNNYLGEIFICYPQVKRQAEQFDQTIKQEFCLLLIHGFLHLWGYDDQTQKDYQQMKKIQDKIFSKIYDKI
ncbi:MAG: rRNA maturation RNase YbeY [Candidatus Buchananbacteria bacterium]|nr:rRNA maturation RNase YbeY [Candidatus Buchananbacteria bacterium]